MKATSSRKAVIALSTIAIVSAGCAGVVCFSTSSNANASTINGVKPEELRKYAVQVPTQDYNAETAYSGKNYGIDCSHADEGYITAFATFDVRAKITLTKDDKRYNYTMPSDGSTISVPVNMGNGTYTISMWSHISGKTYTCEGSTDITVNLDNDNAPYLVPNVFCNYAGTSVTAGVAHELCKEAATDADKVSKCVEYIGSHIKYDYEKANVLKDTNDYIPSPDNTLTSGSGICFDYASLLTSMLRSENIPARIVTGYLEEDDEYHAWVEVLCENGLSNRNLSIHAGSWSFVDVTAVAANHRRLMKDITPVQVKFIY